MASSVQPLQQQQQQHQAKFRWTENLTCRFIQLRKEHGKMFTGRKYSAQAGWEYILRQMREEFPTIMADVHYRVLKKKWSNLLQQYKELKNPVHGDKNKADDISWPFYNAIDEVLCNLGLPRGRRLAANTSPDAYDEIDDEDQDEDLNPQEFLCVSVAPDSDDEDNNMHITNNYEDDLLDDQQQQQREDESISNRAVPGLQPLGRGPVFDVDRLSRAARHSPSRKRSLHTESSSEELLSRLPRATELTIRPVRRSEGLPGTSDQQQQQQQHPPPGLEPINGRGELEIFRDTKRLWKDEDDEDERPKSRKRRQEDEEEPSRLERRIVEFLEYTKKRDEENRSILIRMLEAIEDIRNAIRR